MHVDTEFETVVREHYAPLYRFALSLTQNENDARDLAQQTFYIWATKRHQLRDRSKTKAWLFTTLHREFLSRERRLLRFRHHELSEVESELPEVPPHVPTQLDWQVVSQCLAAMDPMFRAPISLFYLEDYSYNEIAESLDIPLGTVKSRISRGIAQLQQALTIQIGKHITAKPE